MPDPEKDKKPVHDPPPVGEVKPLDDQGDPGEGITPPPPVEPVAS